MIGCDITGRLDTITPSHCASLQVYISPPIHQCLCHLLVKPICNETESETGSHLEIFAVTQTLV